jgi:hypothetical protein
MSNKILASTAGKFIPQQAEQVSKAKQSNLVASKKV